MPFPYRDETKKLNDETRRIADGSFIYIRNGINHYEVSNDAGTKDVVFVHGFSVPYFVFDPTFNFLAQAGFRTLRYDLFGRGYSDRPRARYNMDFFVQQLADLLDALRFSRPLNLIGLSMGGSISATFTARYPERVQSLTLIDPSGVVPVSLGPMLGLAKLPFVAETALGLAGSESMLKTAANDFFDPKLVAHFIDKYRVQMQYEGFIRALLSTVRNNMLGSYVESYKAVGRHGTPVLLFWGRDDTTVPLAHSEYLCAAMPNTQLHIIEQCGHIPHYEKPDEVNPILLKFLREQ